MSDYWSTDPTTFRRQFARRAANLIIQTKPLDVPPRLTAIKVLELGPLRADR